MLPPKLVLISSRKLCKLHKHSIKLDFKSVQLVQFIHQATASISLPVPLMSAMVSPQLTYSSMSDMLEIVQSPMELQESHVSG